MSAKEIAKLVRKELKQCFPGVKFSVRTHTYSMGASIYVKWTNFPIARAVEEAISKYKQVRYDQGTGEILSGGNLFIFCSNDWTEVIKEKIKKEMPENIHPSDHLYHHWFLKTAEKIYQQQQEQQPKEENKTVEIKQLDQPATKRQRWMLYQITKIDTREWDITKGQASRLIGKAKDGKEIQEDLEKMGLIPKKETAARRVEPMDCKPKTKKSKTIH